MTFCKTCDGTGIDESLRDEINYEFLPRFPCRSCNGTGVDESADGTGKELVGRLGPGFSIDNQGRLDRMRRQEEERKAEFNSKMFEHREQWKRESKERRRKARDAAWEDYKKKNQTTD